MAVHYLNIKEAAPHFIGDSNVVDKDERAAHDKQDHCTIDETFKCMFSRECSLVQTYQL